uniref:Uncharacterized protein n=1 Tax=Romanomermis culicivorax TaxID=13658 RepID=A0A915L2S2_ROMCU
MRESLKSCRITVWTKCIPKLFSICYEKHMSTYTDVPDEEPFATALETNLAFSTKNLQCHDDERRPISPQRDAPYTSNIEWDENPEIEEEMDENTLRQLLAAYHKMRAENVAQNELKNGRWINYPRNYPKRNLIKRSYDGPLTNYYGYDVLDDADLSTIRRGPIRIRIPPEYIDVVDDGNPKQGYEFAAPGRNLILIDTASLNGYLPTDGGNDEFLLSGRKGPVSVDPDRLQSEMALEKKIFDLANQVNTKYDPSVIEKCTGEARFSIFLTILFAEAGYVLYDGIKNRSSTKLILDKFFLVRNCLTYFSIETIAYDNTVDRTKSRAKRSIAQNSLSICCLKALGKQTMNVWTSESFSSPRLGHRLS